MTDAERLASKLFADAALLHKAADDMTTLGRLLLSVEAQPELLNQMLTTTAEQVALIRNSQPMQIIEGKAS